MDPDEVSPETLDTLNQVTSLLADGSIQSVFRARDLAAELLSTHAVGDAVHAYATVAWANAQFAVCQYTNDVAVARTALDGLEDLDYTHLDRGLQNHVARTLGRIAFGIGLRTGDGDAAERARKAYGRALTSSPAISADRYQAWKYRRDVDLLIDRIESAEGMSRETSRTARRAALRAITHLRLFLGVRRVPTASTRESSVAVHHLRRATRHLDALRPARATEALKGLHFALRTRYEQLGSLVDLSEALVVIEWATRRDPESVEYESDRGVIMRMLGLHTRDSALLEAAVIACDSARARAGEPCSEEWQNSTWNLAVALKRWFDPGDGEIADLDRAIELEKALLDCPDPIQQHSIATNHAASLVLRARFERDIADVATALETLNGVLDRSIFRISELPAWVTLCEALRLQMELVDDIESQRSLWDASRQLLSVLPNRHPSYVGACGFYTDAVLRLAPMDGDVEILREAVRVIDLALEASVAYPNTAYLLGNKVLLLSKWFEFTESHDVRRRLREARSAFVAAESLGGDADGATFDTRWTDLIEDEWEAADEELLALEARLATADEAEERLYVKALMSRTLGEVTSAHEAETIGRRRALAEEVIEHAKAPGSRAIAAAELVSTADDESTADELLDFLAPFIQNPPADAEHAMLLRISASLLEWKYVEEQDPQLLDSANSIYLTLAGFWEEQPTSAASSRLAYAKNLYRRSRELRSVAGYTDALSQIATIRALLNDGEYDVATFDDLVLWDDVRFYEASIHRAMYLENQQVQHLDRSIDLAMSLKNKGKPLLAIGLIIRYERYGREDDLNHAIELLRQEIEKGSFEEEPAWTCYAELASAHRLRAHRTDNLDDLILARDLTARAIAECDEPDASGALENLAAGLAASIYAATQSSDSLAQAVAHASDAVASASPSSTEKAVALSNFAQILYVASDATEDPHAALSEARDAILEANDLLASQQIETGRQRILQGEIELRLYNTPGVDLPPNSGGLGVLQEVFSDSAESLRIRLEAGKRLTGHLVADEAFAHVVAHFEELLPMLRELAPTWLARGDRENTLAEFADLTGSAVAAALEVGDLDLAVRFFEEGRSLLSEDAAEREADLDRLRRTAPELLQRLLAVEAELDQAAGLHEEGALAASNEIATALRASQDRASLLARIRKLPGLSTFYRLSERATGAPPEYNVILLNISAWRADALIIVNANTLLFPIPIPAEEVATQAFVFATAIEQILSGDGADQSEAIAGDALEALWLAWVRDLVQFVKERIPAKSESSRLPRVHWCPGAVLTMIPWHAVGTRDGGEGVIDEVISSTAPSLRSIWRTAGAVPQAEGSNLTVVAMPNTPGMLDLPYAAEEARWLEQRFGGRVEVYGLDGHRPATSDHVLRALRSCTWAHFACHAVAPVGSTYLSSIVLRDSATSPLTAMKLSEQRLGAHELAFLGACSTGSPSGTLLDDNLNMATAVQQAGFRNVVSAMWPVIDQVSFDVTRAFYQRLPHTPSQSESYAEALHHALREQRGQSPDYPSLWAPYVHMGP